MCTGCVPRSAGMLGFQSLPWAGGRGECVLRSFLLCQQKTAERGKGKLHLAWVSSEQGQRLMWGEGALGKREVGGRWEQSWGMEWGGDWGWVGEPKAHVRRVLGRGIPFPTDAYPHRPLPALLSPLPELLPTQHLWVCMLRSEASPVPTMNPHTL